MSNLTVTERSGVLVVDSRLIALGLGIQHKNFLATIEKYNPKMGSHSEMGPAAFETRVVKRTQGGTYEERWAWLTEPQSTFVMTLSRNTEQVVNCKLALSIAFDQAKRVIKQVIPAQSQEIERLKLELALAQAQAEAAREQRLLGQFNSSVMLLHGSGMGALILGKADAVIERITEIEKTVLCNERGQPLKTFRGLSKTKLAKRYGLKKPQDFVAWLHSLGKAELLQKGLTTTGCEFVPWESIEELDRAWSQRQGTRQRLLGE